MLDPQARQLIASLAERGVRPTALQPFWDVAGFALGAATALIGPEAAMACTAAIEEEIDRHYTHQLDELAEAGVDVILLEEGPPFGAKDFRSEAGESMQRTMLCGHALMQRNDGRLIALVQRLRKNEVPLRRLLLRHHLQLGNITRGQDQRRSRLRQHGRKTTAIESGTTREENRFALKRKEIVRHGAYLDW